MAKNEKKRFVLRIDAEKLKILERWAADDFRSLNGQLEYLLDKAIKEHKRDKKNSEKDNKS